MHLNAHTLHLDAPALAPIVGRIDPQGRHQGFGHRARLQQLQPQAGGRLGQAAALRQHRPGEAQPRRLLQPQLPQQHRAGRQGGVAVLHECWKQRQINSVALSSYSGRFERVPYSGNHSLGANCRSNAMAKVCLATTWS